MGNAPREKFVQPDFDDPCKTLGGCAAKRRESKLRELVKEWRAYSDIQAFMQANNTLKSCADELESLLES